MFEALQEVYHRRDLLYMLAWREIRIKYKQSVMGMLWAVLMPSSIVCAGFIVRLALTKVSGKPIDYSELTSVVVKAAPWAFFVASLRFGTGSLLLHTNLITKIYLPRLVFPLAAVLSQLFDFLVAGVLVCLILIVAGTGLSVHLLWVPLLVGILIVLAAAVAMIFSAGALFFRDVKFIVETFLTFAIFFTPVFYDSALLGSWAPVLLINPVSPILEGITAAVIHQTNPSLPWISYSFVITFVLFSLAIVMFKRLDPLFAENI